MYTGDWTKWKLNPKGNQPWIFIGRTNAEAEAPIFSCCAKSRWHIKKPRHHFANNGPYSQSPGFPVVMCGCESWIIKKSRCWRIDAFKLWCWRRLLRVTQNARRSNQSILKEINPEYSLEGLMLKLKLQYTGHLMWRTNLLEKTLILGKIEGKRRRAGSRGLDG